MKTVIFDLDGTLCDITHRLHFIEGDNKDWDGFYKACPADIPKPAIIELAAMCDDAAGQRLRQDSRGTDCNRHRDRDG